MKALPLILGGGAVVALVLLLRRGSDASTAPVTTGANTVDAGKGVRPNQTVTRDHRKKPL